jgi:hypothetical protein
MGLMDLFRPKWKHSDSSVRCEAVKELEDEKLLLEIAKNDENESVREATKNRLERLELIRKIIKEEDVSVRIAALEELEDQEVLLEIAKKDEDIDVCQTAVYKLKDHVLVADIAKNHENSDLRYTAVEVLAGIAENSKDEAVRHAATEVLTDIAENDEDEVVRQDAMSFLKDLDKPKGSTEEDNESSELMELFKSYLLPGVIDSTEFETRMPLDDEGDVVSVELTSRIEFEKLSEKGKRSALSHGYSEGELVTLVITKSESYRGVDIVTK